MPCVRPSTPLLGMSMRESCPSETAPIMTSAGCGLLARTCLLGTGALPRCAHVVVGFDPSDCLAAARPIADRTGSRQVLFRCRKTRLHDSIRNDPPDGVVAADGTSPAGACRARWRNSRSGCPHKPRPIADWGAGGLLGLGHFGLKPDRSPIAANGFGPKRRSTGEAHVHQGLRVCLAALPS